VDSTGRAVYSGHGQRGPRPDGDGPGDPGGDRERRGRAAPGGDGRRRAADGARAAPRPARGPLRGRLLERETAGIPDEQWRLDPDAVDEDELPDESTVETATEAQATKTTGTETPTTAEETPETAPPDPQAAVPEPLHERMPDAIQAFDPPGTPEETERRRGALHGAYLYLQRRERARRSDFEDDVFPEAPAGDDSPDEGWWDEVVRPGLDALPDPELADGQEPDAGEEAEEKEEAWVYTGENPADVPE
jgi:hypothetical protein